MQAAFADRRALAVQLVFQPSAPIAIAGSGVLVNGASKSLEGNPHGVSWKYGQPFSITLTTHDSPVE
jgi:hypothetical protein